MRLKDPAREEYLELYFDLEFIRQIEDKIKQEFVQSERPPLVPSVALISFGEEAIGVGSAFAADPAKDCVSIGHRAVGALHQFKLAAEEYLSNHFLAASSPMGGRDGNIHFGFPDRRIIKFISHMGGNVPAGCGAADALRYIYLREKPGDSLPAVLCYFGDGASSQGAIHEAMNIAAARNLPVIFIIDNNNTAISTPYEAQTGVSMLALRSIGYGFGFDLANGNDVLDVCYRTYQAIERARFVAAMTREVKKFNLMRAPSIIECRTFRMQGHNLTEKISYDDPREYNEWLGRDPIEFYRNQLLKMKKFDVLSKLHDQHEREKFTLPEFMPEELDKIKTEVGQIIDAAYEKASKASPPGLENLSYSVYPEKYVPDAAHFNPEPCSAFSTVGRKLTKEEKESTVTLAEAVRDALRLALARDPKVRVFGEDVCGAYGKKGGVFGITLGLAEEFNDGDFLGFTGKDRVFDTPISEAAIIGLAIGHALVGLKPVCEIQFMPFISTAMTQLIDMANTHYYSTRFPIGIVVRTAYGLGVCGGHFHASSLTESMFYHAPGLKIVCPSTPYDAKGLLLQAVEEEAPVIFMESIWGYSRVRGNAPKDYYTVPIGKAALRRTGSDLTLITWGARMLFDEVLPVVLEAGKQGIGIDLIDLRTLKPLDMLTINASAAKTRRVLIAHEDVQNGGIGESILAKVVQEYPDTRGKVMGAYDTPVPQHPILEKNYAPTKAKIKMAIKELMDRRVRSDA